MSPDPNTKPIWERTLDFWRPLTVCRDDLGDKLYKDCDICFETIGSVGITSTPVIDVRNQTLYVVTRRSTRRGYADDGINYLHAISITDGKERPNSPVKIEAEIDIFSDIPQTIRFDARCQRNRPGLLLLNGVVYIAYATFSCDQDCPLPDGNPGGDHYRGWIMGYQTSDLSKVAVFCTSPDGGGAGVWQSGNGLVGFDDGTIYFETGNDTAPAKLGDSFVRLQVIDHFPGLVLAAYFQPSNANVLRVGGPLHDPKLPMLGTGDTDLGSGGPLLLPHGWLIGGGKQGRYYVLDRDTMQLTQNNTPVPVIGEGFQAFYNQWNPEYTLTDYAMGEQYGPNIHAGPIYWKGTSYIYQMAEKDRLKAFYYDVTTRTVQETPAKEAKVGPPKDKIPPDGMPGGSSSLSANGDRDGIIWTSFPTSGSAQGAKVDGTLIAFDATDLTELWRDPQPGICFAKFCPPTIADGKVYRATFARNPLKPTYLTNDDPTYQEGKVIVYGLLP